MNCSIKHLEGCERPGCGQLSAKHHRQIFVLRQRCHIKQMRKLDARDTFVYRRLRGRGGYHTKNATDCIRTDPTQKNNQRTHKQSNKQTNIHFDIVIDLITRIARRWSSRLAQTQDQGWPRPGLSPTRCPNPYPSLMRAWAEPAAG